MSRSATYFIFRLARKGNNIEQPSRVGGACAGGYCTSIFGGGATSILWVGLLGLCKDSPLRGGAMLNTQGFNGVMPNT
jgi:hypothetical protein